LVSTLRAETMFIVPMSSPSPGGSLMLSFTIFNFFRSGFGYAPDSAGVIVRSARALLQQVDECFMQVRDALQKVGCPLREGVRVPHPFSGRVNHRKHQGFDLEARCHEARGARVRARDGPH